MKVYEVMMTTKVFIQTSSLRIFCGSAVGGREGERGQGERGRERGGQGREGGRWGWGEEERKQGCKPHKLINATNLPVTIQ